MSQYRISDNTNSFNSTTITNNITIADERSHILAWLSPLEPRLRHQNIQERRVENLGEWVLRTEELRSWYAGSGRIKSDNAVLFCCGDPGVGKTYISSLVIDSLCDQAGGLNATVACFYFDFAAQKEQSPTSMLGALLKQMVGGLEKIPEEISREYQDQRKAIGGRGPRLSGILKMLQTTTSKGPTFICIDALDECVEGHRAKLLNSLNQILMKSPGTRVFVTGRPHIQPEIGRRLAGRTTTISISPKRDDIIRYLHSKLEEDTNPDAMDTSLVEDILKKIPNDISEIFLLVSLNIDAILQETTIHRRRQRLNAMADGLGLEDVYGATLGRIKGQGGEKARLGIATLMWISHAERPLKPHELCHALAVETESHNINIDNVPSIGTLPACCQGLIVVDKEVSTVRLIHSTLQEYLRAHPELFSRAHSTMAETCLSYLNSNQVMALSTSPSRHLEDTPFLEYSSLYWGVHAKRDLSDCAKLLALRLFDNYNNHISIKILLKVRLSHWRYFDPDKPLLFDGLHCASSFGIVELAASLVEVEGCDINQKDYIGNTPLHHSALNGHEDVMKILLGRDEVNPDKPNNHGETPLHYAAENGHEGVVKILLGRDEVKPDKPDKLCRTPLYCAVENGHEGAVKTLLGQAGVNPDKLGFFGLTPLHCAALDGREEVMKILLGREEVNPDKGDNLCRTPLYCAAWNGHEGAVKILLRRDEVKPNKPDDIGQTPLHCAALNGHEGVMKILLGRDEVNPNRPNNYGETPLHYAAEGGHNGVVKILLGRDEVNPDKQDDDGQTPLHWAARSGHGGVVRILLGRDEVNPDKPNNCGGTPLHYAAESGHGGVVKILLGWDVVNPDKPDDDGRTPLHGAALNAHEAAAKILLGRDDISPNKPDNRGRTPLYRAASNGHDIVVKILLELVEVNPEKPDIHCRTLLRCAAMNGHEGVVKILLERDEASPDKLDDYGQTPLHCAAMNGHEGAVKILLERDDVDPDKPDDDGQTPLYCAASNGHEEVVKILLARDEVNPDKPYRFGQTPLHRAAKGGHEGVVKILLGREEANPDKPNIYGQTPLHCAAWNGHEGVVKILLERYEVNPDKPDIYGRTSLHCAAQDGHKGVVKILLGLSGVNPNKPDNIGRTPLDHAVKNKHEEVIALLQFPQSSTLSPA